LNETLEKIFFCLGVSSLFQVYVHNFAILIDGPPDVVWYATNLYERFVQKVGIAKAGVSAAKTFSKLRTGFVSPEPDCFVAKRNISFGK